jgi:hypothetical protein
MIKSALARYVPRRGDLRCQPTRCGVREGLVADKVSMVEMSGRDRSGGVGTGRAGRRS